MDTSSRHGRRDSSREIAVGDEPDARAGFPNIGDKLLVPRAVECYILEKGLYREQPV